MDDVLVGNIEVRRSSGQGLATLELYYRVSTGPDFSPHDPSRFVKLVSGRQTIAPSWAPPAINVPPRSHQDIMVRFNLPAPPPLVFRFGEEQPVDISVQ
ncbi:hypothetical protein [Siccirubricoccus sp. G192]|uniref:hypothetical protein n=1 Tax=Siccirubricoccus sp. G192 TaxID=2849651 RepID=UPI001C2C1B7C|nr:hypothetical protein [Siccirubricoccus sp. G192]MBV1799360.1 hypothetical protein [Siccirubricoccus sp. G192]